MQMQDTFHIIYTENADKNNYYYVRYDEKKTSHWVNNKNW